jgi:hypothetical protein
VREGKPASRAGRLEDDGPHGVRHSLHHRGDFDTHGDQVPDRIVDGQTIGDVAPRAVDVKRDGPSAVIGEFAKPLDDSASDVFLDVTDEVDIAQPVRLLPAHQSSDRLDEFVQQPLVQLAHWRQRLHAACRPRVPGRFV